MDRFWIAPARWGETLLLEGEEAHHCARVMRKRPGDSIEVFDGKGRWARGVISSVHRDRVDFSIEESGVSVRVSPEIEIAVGIPKGKLFDLIVQKAVELGVARIHPILSDQGMVRISESEAPKKRGKWQKVALEASKQCGQNHLPEVSLPRTMDAFLEEENRDCLKIVGALLPGVVPMREVLASSSEGQSIVLMVGPEGDFSEREYCRIRECGFRPVTLGPLVLRVETAILSMIAAVRYQY